MNSADWRAEKVQFKVMTGRAWPNPECSKRGRHTREYVFDECWQIFVDDRLVHTNAQSKTVFSHASTVMDNIDGWEEENMGGIQICGMHVDLHKSRVV